MSIFSTLFGASNLAGPDFSDTTHKVLHIHPLSTISYEMPGNMSDTLNFAQLYAKESVSTIKVDLGSNLQCEQWHWRQSCDLDGGMWDYKMKGSTTLTLRIELMPIKGGNTIQEQIMAQYDAFLNGPDGLNTSVREDSPGFSDEELGTWIKAIPDDFGWYSIDGKRVLTWSEGDNGSGSHARYHAIALKEDLLLNFAFLYSVSTNSEKELKRIKQQVPEDINRFMSRLEIAPIQ